MTRLLVLHAESSISRWSSAEFITGLHKLIKIGAKTISDLAASEASPLTGQAASALSLPGGAGTRAVEVHHYRLRKRASPLWDQRNALINRRAQQRGEKKERQP